MSQGSTVLPTTGTVSGLAFAQDANAALNALLSQNSGSSAPTNTLSGVPDKGQMWLDTSVTPNAVRMYDGTNWVLLGYLDSANHLWAPPIGGGSATIASASTTDIFANSANTVTVSGTATITQFANASAVPGTRKLVIASGAFTMTHDATKLILPTGRDVVVSAGDSFEVSATSSTNVKVLNYTKADGTSLQVSNRFIGEIIPFMGLTPPPLTVLPFGQTLSRSAYSALWTFAQAEITAGSTFFNVGNGSTTFGIGDLRGCGLAGLDNMGGTRAFRLSSAYFGLPTTMGAFGGTEAITLISGQIPPVSFSAISANDSPDHAHPSSTTSATVGGGQIPVATTVGGTQVPAIPANINTFSTGGALGRHQHLVAGAINGGGGAHSNLQPTALCNLALYAGQ